MPSPVSLFDRRLVIVSGKGGVGKTTVACALAEGARQAGLRVLLAETSAIESVAAHFEPDPRPLDYAGRELRPNLHALRIDPHEALAEYVRLQTRAGLVTDRVLQTETFRQLLDAAPGWRELIVLGKIWQVEQKADRKGHPLYDLVVVDAPATGHGLTFLDVPRVVQQAVRAGPLARHAGWVEELIHDPARTLLLPVALPEELPVLETIELVERARDKLDIAVDRLVINRAPTGATLGLSDWLSALPDDTRFESLPEAVNLKKLVGQSEARDERARYWRNEAARECDLPVVDLPRSPDLADLANALLAEPLLVPASTHTEKAEDSVRSPVSNEGRRAR